MKMRKFNTKDNIPTNKKENEVKWVQVKIQQETKKRLKLEALQHGLEMQEIADEAINRYLDQL